MLIDADFLSPTLPHPQVGTRRDRSSPQRTQRGDVFAGMKRIIHSSLSVTGRQTRSPAGKFYSSHRKVHGVWAESGSLMMLLTDIPPALWNAVGNYFTGAFLCDLCVLCERQKEMGSFIMSDYCKLVIDYWRLSGA